MNSPADPADPADPAEVVSWGAFRSPTSPRRGSGCREFHKLPQITICLFCYYILRLVYHHIIILLYHYSIILLYCIIAFFYDYIIVLSYYHFTILAHTLALLYYYYYYICMLLPKHKTLLKVVSGGLRWRSGCSWKVAACMIERSIKSTWWWTPHKERGSPWDHFPITVWPEVAYGTEFFQKNNCNLKNPKSQSK